VAAAATLDPEETVACTEAAEVAGVFGTGLPPVSPAQVVLAEVVL
jgi:hypothetical protein